MGHRFLTRPAWSAISLVAIIALTALQLGVAEPVGDADCPSFEQDAQGARECLGGLGVLAAAVYFEPEVRSCIEIAATRPDATPSTLAPCISDLMAEPAVAESILGIVGPHLPQPLLLEVAPGDLAPAAIEFLGADEQKCTFSLEEPFFSMWLRCTVEENVPSASAWVILTGAIGDTISCEGTWQILGYSDENVGKVDFSAEPVVQSITQEANNPLIKLLGLALSYAVGSAGGPSIGNPVDVSYEITCTADGASLRLRAGGGIGPREASIMPPFEASVGWEGSTDCAYVPPVTDCNLPYEHAAAFFVEETGTKAGINGVERSDGIYEYSLNGDAEVCFAPGWSAKSEFVTGAVVPGPMPGAAALRDYTWSPLHASDQCNDDRKTIIWEPEYIAYDPDEVAIIDP